MRTWCNKDWRRKNDELISTEKNKVDCLLFLGKNSNKEGSEDQRHTNNCHGAWRWKRLASKKSLNTPFLCSQLTKKIKRINTLFYFLPLCKNTHVCSQDCLDLDKYSRFVWCCVLFKQISPLSLCLYMYVYVYLATVNNWTLQLFMNRFSAISALSYPSFWLWCMLQMCRVSSSEHKVFIPSYHFIGMPSLVIFGPLYRNRRKLNVARVCYKVRKMRL